MDWPGVYGAILSTLVLAWTIRTGLRDRGHLRLDIRLRRYEQDKATGEMVEMPLESPDGLELHLTMTNVGRRPVVVDAWRTRNGVTLAQPTRREPLGEAERCSTVVRNVVDRFATGLPRMYVTDSAGRRWYVPRRQLRSTAKQIRLLRTAGQVSK
jgi:hypothetical protein